MPLGGSVIFLEFRTADYGVDWFGLGLHLDRRLYRFGAMTACFALPKGPKYENAEYVWVSVLGIIVMV